MKSRYRPLGATGAIGDTQQQRHDDPVRDERRAAVGHEGECDPGEGEETQHPAQDEHGLHDQGQRQAPGEQFAEGIPGAQGDAEAGGGFRVSG